jgi:hypothetical protein
MFTLRPSEPRTVLLWGDRWHFPDREASEPFTHVMHAAELLAAHFAEEPKPLRLRLVFQPESLDSVPVACPHGDRRVLAFALAADHPALAQPDHAWGHEPVLPAAEGFSTILHYEVQPALIALATQLARLGLAVDSAWPLATFLHALPEDWSDSGGTTVVAVSAKSGVAYHHPTEGVRSVLTWRGESTPAEAGRWLAGILDDRPEEVVLLVCDEEESASALGSCLGEQERPNLEIIRMREALGRRVVLPRYHPAQLLPREPIVTAQRVAIAASIALLFAAGWAGYAFGQDWLAAQKETESQRLRLAELQAEVSHLRANAAEIAASRSLVEGGAGGPPCADFMRALSRQTPPGMVLSMVRIDGRDIRAEGWISPSAPADLLDSWRRELASSDAPWTLDIRPGVGGAFTATGAFRL